MADYYQDCGIDDEVASWPDPNSEKKITDARIDSLETQLDNLSKAFLDLRKQVNNIILVLSSNTQQSPKEYRTEYEDRNWDVNF